MLSFVSICARQPTSGSASHSWHSAITFERLKTNDSPRCMAWRPTEKNSTSSRSTTTIWYGTDFPRISMNSTPTFTRSHSTGPSCESTAVQRQTRCTRSFAAFSATLWTEELHPFPVLDSGPQLPLLASIEVGI